MGPERHGATRARGSRLADPHDAYREIEEELDFHLALGWLGLFGVMSHSVARRTKEIGLRRALGAGRDTVMASVLGEAVRLNLVGLAIGLVGAAALARLMESQLFGVTILDPPTYATVAFTLFLVAGLAAWVPARRAGDLDPASALRTD